MRKPSAETELRTVRRELKLCKAERTKDVTLMQQYRARATKAEQELATWKQRFDRLLWSTGKVEDGAGGQR